MACSFSPASFFQQRAGLRPCPAAGWFLLGIAGVWLGFANALTHIPVLALLYPMILTLFALRAASAGQAFRWTFALGLCGSAAALYWIAVPVRVYGGLPWIAAVPCPLLLGAYLGLYAGAFGLFLHAVARRALAYAWGPLLFILSGIAAWSVLEHLRGFLLSGFPWLTLSSAFAAWPVAIQGASLVGAYALSGILAGIGVGLGLGVWARAGARHSRTGVQGLAAAALLAALLAAWGFVSLRTPAPSVGPKLEVVLVQGNIDQNQKWQPAYQKQTLDHYLAMSRAALRAAPLDRPGVVIWPETAMPFYFQSSALGGELLIAAHQARMPLLFGAPGFNPVKGVPESDWPLFNRAYLLDPDTLGAKWYDKEHLVPFGEYLPEWLDFPWLKIFFQGVGAFSKGQKTAPLYRDAVAMGILICYETTFPELAQERVARGATVLVNISNDAWFGRTAAPVQHLHQTVMRAVEQGRWLVRATNTGISAVVDDKGRIVARSGLYTTETMRGHVPVLEKNTVFHNHGRFILVVIYAIFLVALGVALLSARKKRIR